MMLAEQNATQVSASELFSCTYLAQECYFTTQPLLHERLKLLKLEAQEIEGELYVTFEQVQKLDAFYARLQIGWAVSLALGLNTPFHGV